MYLCQGGYFFTSVHLFVGLFVYQQHCKTKSYRLFVLSGFEYFEYMAIKWVLENKEMLQPTSPASSTAGTGQSAWSSGNLQTELHSGSHERPWADTQGSDLTLTTENMMSEVNK